MKIMHLNCGMGAAGDMFMGALLDLIDNKNSFIDKINSIGIPDIKVIYEDKISYGTQGIHIGVTYKDMEELPAELVEDEHKHEHESADEYQHEHVHSTMHSIKEILNKLDISTWVYENALRVYELIAEAESYAHGVPVEQIHFHEVGMMDAVADIVGTCILMEQLAPEVVLSTAVHAGSGHVRCAHGVLPVPAPATEYILRDVPYYQGDIKGELCTPTGAALISHFVDMFIEPLNLENVRTGYGMGTKDFGVPSFLEITIGEGEVD